MNGARSPSPPRPELRDEELELRLRETLTDIARNKAIQAPALNKEVLHVNLEGDDHPLVLETNVWLAPCIDAHVTRAQVENFAITKLGLQQKEQTSRTTSFAVPDDAAFAKLVLTFENDRLREYLLVET